MIYSFQIMLRHFFGFLAPPWVSCAQNFEATCQRFQSPFLSSESQSKQVQKRAIPPRDVDLHIRCISDSWRLEERKRSGVALSYKLKEHLLMVTRQKSSDYSLYSLIILQVRFFSDSNCVFWLTLFAAIFPASRSYILTPFLPLLNLTLPPIAVLKGFTPGLH